MSRVRFRPQVFVDFEDIWTRGAERWGEGHADRYKSELDAVLILLSENPRMAPERHTHTMVFRAHPFRAHMILYRELPEAAGIEILRIVHGHADRQRLT